MRNFYIVVLVGALMCSVSANSQKTTVLTPDQYNGYGVVYTLPYTALEIDVHAKHTVYVEGPFNQYAKKYIGASQAITSNDEKWEITGINVRTYGVANDSVQYRMQLKAGQNVWLNVADDGMLLSINTESDAPKRGEKIVNSAPMQLPSGEEYLQYVSEDFLGSQSSAKRAQMLAESILEVREARLNLTRGTAETMPTDGKQLELMLNSLAHQEKLMTEAFCGSVHTETTTSRYSFIPFEDGKYVLARLGDYSGFVDAENLSGAPIYVTVSGIRRGEVPLDEKGEPRRMPKDGVMYCVPGSAQISISYDGKNFYDKEVDLAQFGAVFALDPTLFTAKKSPSFARFNAATGALVEIGTK